MSRYRLVPVTCPLCGLLDAEAVAWFTAQADRAIAAGTPRAEVGALLDDRYRPCLLCLDRMAAEVRRRAANNAN